VLLCVGNFLIGDGCKVYKRNKKIFKWSTNINFLVSEKLDWK
jgi:hypothetical protein